MQEKISLIKKSLIYGDEVSLAVLDTTALVQEAITRHNLSPVAAAALGRTLTVTAYLCSWLKEEEAGVSVTVNGDGVGGKICVSGNGKYHLRGFIEHPQVELPPRNDGKLDVGGCVGKHGTVTVIREEGNGLPFVGTSELISGEIAEDFSSYFLTSEQRPTAIAVGVKIAPDGSCMGAGGVILQPLPFASEESISRAEEVMKNFSKISTLIKDLGVDGVMQEYFGVESDSFRQIFYQCHCSQARIESVLHSMGKEELLQVIKEEGKVSVHCHYCNTDYDFTDADVARLFEQTEPKE